MACSFLRILSVVNVRVPGKMFNAWNENHIHLKIIVADLIGGHVYINMYIWLHLTSKYYDVRAIITIFLCLHFIGNTLHLYSLYICKIPLIVFTCPPFLFLYFKCFGCGFHMNLREIFFFFFGMQHQTEELYFYLFFFFKKINTMCLAPSFLWLHSYINRRNRVKSFQSTSKWHWLQSSDIFLCDP